MSERIARREALRHLVVLSAAAAAPTWLLGCSKKMSCLDVTGLSSDEVTMRNTTAAYLEQATDPAKKCVACVQYVAGAANACGTCKVVKGPINPDGSCKLFVAKPA